MDELTAICLRLMYGCISSHTPFVFMCSETALHLGAKLDKETREYSYLELWIFSLMRFGAPERSTLFHKKAHKFISANVDTDHLHCHSRDCHADLNAPVADGSWWAKPWLDDLLLSTIVF